MDKLGFSGENEACSLTLVEVHCVEINETIAKTATRLADKILETMATDNRKSNDLICQQFLSIRKQLREVVQQNAAAPTELAEQYAEFEFLLNGEAENTVETLLSKPRQLADYEGEINRLRNAAAAGDPSCPFLVHTS